MRAQRLRAQNDDAVLGRRLRLLREELGVPRARLALDLGVEAETIRHYESGRNMLKMRFLPVIADSLGVSLAYLIDRLFGQSRLNANEVYRRRPARRGGPVLAAVGT